jgi:hypothetical protein
VPVRRADESGELEAAVDGQDLAGQPSRRRGSQLNQPVGDFLGGSAAGERDSESLVGLHLVGDVGGESRGGEGFGFGGAGGNGVDADLVGASSRAQLRVSCSIAALAAA